MDVAERITSQFARANVSERAVAERTGISQPTLNRIKRGLRAPKLNELISLAGALGCTVSELTGDSPVADRLLCSARSTSDGSTSAMLAELTHYFELAAFLDEQGVPR